MRSFLRGLIDLRIGGGDPRKRVICVSRPLQGQAGFAQGPAAPREAGCTSRRTGAASRLRRSTGRTSRCRGRAPCGRPRSVTMCARSLRRTSRPRAGASLPGYARVAAPRRSSDRSCGRAARPRAGARRRTASACRPARRSPSSRSLPADETPNRGLTFVGSSRPTRTGSRRRRSRLRGLRCHDVSRAA